MESPKSTSGAESAQALPRRPKETYHDIDVMQETAESGVKLEERPLAAPARSILSTVRGAVGRVVRASGHVLQLVQHLADVHTTAKGMHGPLASHIRVYQLRSEISVRIGTVHGHMLGAVYSMRILREIEGPQDELMEYVSKQTIEQLTDTIRDFGAYVDVYHGHQWQPMSDKLLLEYYERRKLELERIQEHFEAHRTALQRIIDTKNARQTHSQLKDLSVAMVKLNTTTASILARVANLERIQATNVTEKYREDVIHEDDTLLVQSESSLHVTQTMQETLRRDYNDVPEARSGHEYDRSKAMELVEQSHPDEIAQDHTLLAIRRPSEVNAQLSNTLKATLHQLNVLSDLLSTTYGRHGPTEGTEAAITDTVDKNTPDAFTESEVLLSRIGLLFDEKVPEAVRKTIHQELHGQLEGYSRQSDKKSKSTEKTVPVASTSRPQPTAVPGSPSSKPAFHKGTATPRQEGSSKKHTSAPRASSPDVHMNSEGHRHQGL